MNASSSPPTVYLVGVDGSPNATHALSIACSLASALRGGAELHMVNVLPVVHAVTGMNLPVELPSSYELDLVVLEEARRVAAASFGGKVSGHVVPGEPWREIVRLAATISADLIIVGTAGRTGLARIALGSVAEQVVRHAGCPVLVVRPKDHHLTAEPTIEPPCNACVEVQMRTGGAQLWCGRHSAHHPPGHLHYEYPPTFGVGATNFRPPS